MLEYLSTNNDIFNEWRIRNSDMVRQLEDGTIVLSDTKQIAINLLISRLHHLSHGGEVIGEWISLRAFTSIPREDFLKLGTREKKIKECLEIFKDAIRMTPAAEYYPDVTFYNSWPHQRDVPAICLLLHIHDPATR